MSAFYLYDDARARGFEPFALSRPVGELRAGALLIRERWEHALGIPCAGFIGASHLADFVESGAPSAVTAGVLPVGSVIVNSRYAPALARSPAADVWRCENQVGALRLLRPLHAAEFSDGLVALESFSMPTARMATLRGWWLEAPWDLVRHLGEMLTSDIAVLGAGIAPTDTTPLTLLGAQSVFIEEGAQVEPLVVIDASVGPVLVRRGATVAAFTRLVGPVYVAPGAQVLGGKVSTCSIGEQCRVHGELSSTIFVGQANKGHDGFVGHSVLGRWVNLGASTVTSNLKNTYGSVQLWTPQGVRDTGMQFLGTMFGDHAKTAIGTRLTTGSVVGAGANVVGSGMLPKVVVPFSWGEGDVVYDVDKFVIVAERVMARRGVSLGDQGRRHLERIFAARWRANA